jgi:hypothetical protein
LLNFVSTFRAPSRFGLDNCSEISITFVMPDLIRHPVEKARRRRTLFDWTPDQIRGDAKRFYEQREAHFGSTI